MFEAQLDIVPLLDWEEAMKRKKIERRKIERRENKKKTLYSLLLLGWGENKEKENDFLLLGWGVK